MKLSDMVSKTCNMIDDNQKIRIIREALMEADKISEVNDIRDSNLDFLNEYPELFTQAKKTRTRINRLRRMARQNTSIIYLN
jgi:ADP-ribosylglycohydrolase